jgi:hypothetical protein
MNQNAQQGMPPRANGGYQQQNHNQKPLDNNSYQHRARGNHGVNHGIPQQRPANNNGYAPHDSGMAPARQNPVGLKNAQPAQHQGGNHAQSHELYKQQNNASKPERPDWWLQLNTYGGKCAFQVESSQTKDNWFTVNIESAPKENPNDAQNKRYLWSQKTIIQMTRSELPIFAAVMLGMLPSVRFDNHGDNSKWLEVINQDKNFFIKSGGAGVNIHVAPVQTVEAYMYGTMAVAQYARNFNGLSCEAALQIISRLANQLFNHGSYKQAQQR